MTTGIKNGKHHAINIRLLKFVLLLTALAFPALEASSSGPDKNWVIVIDAGHGGKDPGAIGSFSAEKNITLGIALKTGSYFEQNLKNVTVIYTRKTDTFVELKDRPAIANKNNADLFISIHANSAKQKNIKGTETFVMGLAKDQQNLEVAMKENEVIFLENDYSTSYEGFDPKSPESYIMFSLMQNIYLEQSTGLASKIQSEYRSRTINIDRGVKQAGFWVLFNTTMPSVLTEAGFITNPEEEKILNSKEGQDKIAAAIFRACSEYIDEIDSKSSRFPAKITDAVTKNETPKDKKEENETASKPDTGTSTRPEDNELFFMVQIGTSSTKTETKPVNFKGLKDVIELEGQDKMRYASGKFIEYKEAVNYRKQIENLYPDAFVIAVRDNKILPLQQALDQKKEFSKRDIK
jgi:N-acetylmuramoyl-L-alanine amidase